VVEDDEIERLRREVVRLGKPPAVGVSILGHGSRRSCGIAVQSDSTLSTSGLLGWFHAPEDMVLVVGAGESLASVQERLRVHHQRLSVDPPMRVVDGEVDLGTVGGLVATADQGSLRYRYGGVRELVIGARYLTSDGIVAQSGSQVIKNVAGYEIAKVLVGSLGTLAVLTDVAVRLHPLPSEIFEVVVEGISLKTACYVGSRLARRSVALSALFYWNGSLVARVEGEGEATRKLAERTAAGTQVEIESLELAGGHSAVQVFSGDDWSQRFARFCGADDLVLRVGCRGFEAHAVEGALEEWNDLRPVVSSYLGSGIVDLRWPASAFESGDDRGFRSIEANLGRFLGAFPQRWWRQLPSWARDRLRTHEMPSLDPNAVTLMRSLKAAFDPDSLFERGRMGAWYEGNH
jgi:glycolate oxidase FAD binding subunit